MRGRASGASHCERASSMPRLDGMVMEVERIGEEIIFDTVDSPLSLGLHSFSFLSPSVTFLLLFILSLYFLSFFLP